MRSAQFYAIAIFVIGWLLPRQGWCGSDGAAFASKLVGCPHHLSTTPKRGTKPARDENRYRVKLRRAHKIFSTP